MTQVIKTTFQLRRGLLEVWERNNPILAKGEPSFVLDKNALKIGDGVTPWKELDYIGLNQEDLAKAIEDYFKENPGSGTGGGSGSGTINPEDIAAAVEDYLSKNPPEVPDLSDEVERAETAAQRAESANSSAQAALSGAAGAASDANAYAQQAQGFSGSASGSAGFANTRANDADAAASKAEEAASDAEAAADRAEEAAKVTTDLDTTLTQAGKAADAKAVGDAISKLSGGNVELDTTLTQSGKAADAKAVGDKIAEITGISLVEPAEDDIPKVFFTGDTTGMNKSTAVDLDFEYRSKTAKYSGVANVKWQGSSSLSYPEKNYTIKLFTDATKEEKLKLDMKSWGKENKFCLKANYVDTLHLRNLVGARIAYDMIKSRSDFNSLPTEMQNAPRCGVVDGFPVKVFINGMLQGIYTWNIPKDKWMMNMDDENANHAFLMAEKNNNGSATSDPLILACEFRANATIFADTSTEQYPPYDWVVEGPGDDVTADVRASFNALIDCVKDTDDETFKATIENHLDLTSAFDYYSFAYLLCHYDGLAKNLGMATYDGQKWFCILYDMDSTFGATINGSGFLATDRKCPEQYQETNSLLWQRIERCFAEELYTRYLELRSGALSMANILTHAERFYDSIPTEYYAEDRSIWTSKPSKDTNTITRLRKYVVERATYVDSEMLAIGAGGGSEPDEPDEPTEATLVSISASYSGGDMPVGTSVAELTGIVVTATYSDGSSKTVTEYTLSGTIAEGSNTITVEYDGLTTTFTVNGVSATNLLAHSFDVDNATATSWVDSVDPSYQFDFTDNPTIVGGVIELSGAKGTLNKNLGLGSCDSTVVVACSLRAASTWILSIPNWSSGILVGKKNGSIKMESTKGEAIAGSSDDAMWHILTVKYIHTERNIFFYSDAVLIGSITATGIENWLSTLIYINKDNSGANAIKWIKVYRGALTDEEIASFEVSTVDVAEISLQKGKSLATTEDNRGGFINGNSNVYASEEYIAVEKDCYYVISLDDNSTFQWPVAFLYDENYNCIKMLFDQTDSKARTNVMFGVSEGAYLRFGCSSNSGAETVSATVYKVQA